MNQNRWIGAVILAVVACALFINALFFNGDPAPGPPEPDFHGQITVQGYAGNLKIPLLENPEVVKILHDRYGLTVKAEGAATTDMLCNFDLAETDFLWAGDQSQIGIYEKCNNRHDPFQNILLNPMVIYSWTGTANALIAEGVAQVSADGIYTVDMVALLELLESGKHWTDLGFENRPSRIVVQATNPSTSNSGRLFAGLLANNMNCQNVVTTTTVNSILPGIEIYFEGLGYLETSSLALFKNYLIIGEGGYPMVALLESQIVDFLTENPDFGPQVANDIRMLYPEPTVWTTHPLIARTEGGKRLMAALLDPEIQQIAWTKYGFRPAVPGVKIDVAALPVTGVQPQIESVLDLPADAAMETIVSAALGELPPGAMPPPPDCPPATTPPATPDATPASPVAMQAYLREIS